MEPEMIEAIERFRAEHLPPIESQSDAIRRLLRDRLAGLGYLPSDQEGTRPEDLNASNDD